MTSEQEHKLYTTLGCIQKGVEGLEEKVEKQNGDLAAVVKKVQRHDVFIGKIGAIVATSTFVVTIGVNAAIAAYFRFWR